MEEFCPFCDKSSDEIIFSDEHIIPESLGGTLTIRICKACNDTLGSKVNSLLINSGHIKLANYAAAIKGKRKTTVNPFEKASIVNDPSTKIRIELDSEKKPYIRYLPKPFKIIKKDDKDYIDNIVIDDKDYSNLPEMVNKFLKRKGHKSLSNEEIYNSVTEIISESPMIHSRFEFKPFDYYPCLLKIAYEIALKCLGNNYLNDNCALRIRESINQIREGKSKPTQNWAKNIEDLISFMPNDGIADIYPSYFNIALLNIDSESQVYVYISILGVITAFIMVSRTSDEYEDIDFMYVNDSSQYKTWVGNTAEVSYNSRAFHMT